MPGRPDAETATFALVVGGGTAGHVLPGLAIARALVDRGHDPASIHFVGSTRGMENTLVPAAGFGLTTLPGRGIQRRLTVENLSAMWGLLRAGIKGIGIVRRRRPAAIITLGGYASVACTLGAVIWRVPIIVTEQNAKAGAANRLAGRFAKACAVPFAETDLPRLVVTGNPVRPEVLAVDRATGRKSSRDALGLPLDRTVIAVVTGSLGARRVNTAVLEALPDLAARGDLAIRHVVGTRDWDLVQASTPSLPGHAGSGLVYQQIPYEDRMELVLAAADLLIGRAGGSTVAELAEVGLGSILVPLPIAPRDHQTANAAALVGVGAAILVPDDELTGRRLVEVLLPLLDNPEALVAMGDAARTLAHPDAADRVAELVEKHARRDRR
jgi:UDP-N-acetylglucosamine--N-acetylmuramyl-(pentapeptide) pyrophosphoryl-undecaprenol N-acetylglucosamine transferase